MNPIEVVQLVGLGLDVAGRIEQLIANLRSQSGLTDDQILDAALAQDAATHARVKSWIEKVQSGQAVQQSPPAV